jgi:glutamate/tyrosine decarboxylase-like PLP-dependent enzyme
MPDPDPSFLYMAAGGSESILMAMKAARDWARNKWACVCVCVRLNKGLL